MISVYAADKMIIDELFPICAQSQYNRLYDVTFFLRRPDYALCVDYFLEEITVTCQRRVKLFMVLS